tara:strand:+ start:792889 stop:793113 length:225 start_codon:yes stop_codon:yes gene_type:complete
MSSDFVQQHCSLSMFTQDAEIAGAAQADPAASPKVAAEPLYMAAEALLIVAQLVAMPPLELVVRTERVVHVAPP